MKTAKFKNSYKKRTLLAMMMTIIITCILTSYITNRMSEAMINYTKNKVEKMNMTIMQKAFNKDQGNEIDIDKILYVIKNSNEEIVEVDFNIQECSDILDTIIDYINDEFSNYNFNGYRLDIPIGAIYKSPLLMNLGPKIPIKVEISDYAFGNVNTVIREFGINNVLVEIYLEIKLKTIILFPTIDETKETSYESLLTSKIINGKVPEFYNGLINAKSNDVSLSLNQDLWYNNHKIGASRYG